MSRDNVFRHVNTESAHAAIIGLIYYSTWMGALGWDIVSTIPFDVRVIQETSWSSSFSSIYSIAYLLSRYVSLSWLITVVTNSVIMTDTCGAWMKSSIALFSIAISATMLVFCLRTCSIWHMKQNVVSLVVSTWLLVVAFAVLLPVMSYGAQLPTSNFCAWHFNGLYVVGVFGALLLFELLCLILTVCKLNKDGWRGLTHGLFTSSRHNLDAEDVKTMLVQKTTAFFIIQFLFLISALLVYVLTDTYAYRMMNIVASVAVASSMAGRIFRRAWRQTRELAPHNINRPPSYFPAWAEEHHDAPFHRRDDTSSCSPSIQAGDGGRAEGVAPKPSRGGPRDKHDSLDFYVEGEFGPKLKSRSMSSPSLPSLPRTPVTSGAAQQMREMEAGQARVNHNGDTVSITPSTMVIARKNLVVPTPAAHIHSSDHSAPANSGHLSSPALSRLHTCDHDVTHRSRSIVEMFSLRRGTHMSAPNMQGRLSTADSQALSVNGSLIFSDSLDHDAANHHSNGEADHLDHSMSARLELADLNTDRVGRDEDKDSDNQQGFIMEEKRRIFITSPPLTAAVRINNKEVYDFDSVKAAARFGGRYGQMRNAFGRPATASSLSIAPGSTSSGRGAMTEDSRRCHTGGSIAQPGATPCAFLRKHPTLQEQSTPRPKTAPSWSSPSISPFESTASQAIDMPRKLDMNSRHSGSTQAAASVAFTASASKSATEDDILLAFLNTVERDSRDRICSNAIDSQASVSISQMTGIEDERPRTTRGNTDSSGRDSDEARNNDLNTILVHGSDKRGRRASSAARPQSAKRATDASASSSASPRRRVGTSKSNRSDGGSNSGTRPSTAVGDVVKPFGLGVLGLSSRRGSRARSLREQPSSSISDDEEGEAEAELGMVIQRQYAKLAAQAQMPLDPPC
ncbi:uncharacterized protein MEPE_06624 [Melanopsichium pennsylvanicum]|uniref:Uncharacterized protein n=2 Tax=Melanopsichium pennsylvanicum TaxID=63383 RepID=A0AAJ5C8R5_9BASI|nr:uncharacterized protein MEPE_06624 [Melanopsichium pennsylvanicum]